jgi:hypothetical protein
LALQGWVVDRKRADGPLVIVIDYQFLDAVALDGVFIHGTVEGSKVVLVVIAQREFAAGNADLAVAII